MKKLWKTLFGGIKTKTVLLVLITLLAALAVFFATSYYQSRSLTGIVGETRVEQQQAISRTSEETMHNVLVSTMESSTALQARIADNDFAEIVRDTYMLQTMAQGLIERKDRLRPAELALPDAAMDGIPTAMVLTEAGVDYTRSEYLPVVGHMSSSMLAMFRNSDKISACYIGLADGTHLGVDDHSANRFDADGNLLPFPVRERPWYRGAVESGGLYFTGIENDAFSGVPCITCSVPVVVDGETVGVVGIDIVLDSMNNFVNSSSSSAGFAVIVNDHGHVILAPEENAFFEVTTADRALDLRETENREFSQFVRRALTENTALTSIAIGGREYYLAGAPMPTVGWTVISIVDKDVTEAPEKALLADYDRINDEASARFRESSGIAQRSTQFIVLILFLAGVTAALAAAGKIVRPLEEMTENIKESSETGRLFEMKDSYRSSAEIEVLAEAFDDLSKKTKQYIEDITQITKEKERVSTELNMASQIQTGMLPHIFPAFPNRSEFDVYAAMDPAREVGGDFYDFYLIDEDHLALVIADVSGKGVPGALFMMVSKAILKNNAMAGKSAAEILRATNETICTNNKMQMFVTVWIGILEISTGKITAANAGHEYPAIQQDGRFSLLKDKHSFIIGGMEGVKYKEYTIQLKPGDRIFLYTDGVPEATDAAERMFGTQRMIDALNAEPDVSPEAILNNIRRAVERFVCDAEQFDDLTMLCLEYKGSAADAQDAGDLP